MAPKQRSRAVREPATFAVDVTDMQTECFTPVQSERVDGLEAGVIARLPNDDHER